MGLSSEFSHLDSPMDAAHNMSVRSVARSEQNLVLLCLLSRSYRIGFLKIGCKDTSFQIADYERLYPLLAETEFPDELVMNYWPEKFFDYLGI